MSRALRKNLAIGFGLLLLTSLPSAAGAQEVVLASDTLPPVGTQIISTETIEMPSIFIKVSAPKTEVPSTASMTQRIASTITVLAPDKFRLAVTENAVAGELSVIDSATASPHVESLIKDTPILMERSRGLWKVSLENGVQISRPQADEIFFVSHEACLNVGEDLALYGPAKHEPGQKWEVDVTKLVYFESLAKPAGTISAEFVKIEPFAGEECATIKLSFDLTAGSSEGQKAHLKGESIIHRSIADRIDLDSKVTATKEITLKTVLGQTSSSSGKLQKQRTTSVKKP